MTVSESILIEQAVSLGNFFTHIEPNFYGSILRHSPNFPTLQSKIDTINMIEEYREDSGAGLPEITIPVSRLIATQPDVQDELVAMAMRGDLPKGFIPFVVKMNNKYYIIDGHHRTTTEIIQKKKEVKVHLLDLDDYASVKS